MPKKSPKSGTTAPKQSAATTTGKHSSKKAQNKKEDVVFDEDLANFLGDNFTTDEEEEGEDNNLVFVGPTTDKDAGKFWKQTDIPEKYPLDHVNVENLVNMLSKIRLVWPENLPHYDEVEYSTEPERAKYPTPFYHNSDKEKIVLWHAENFRRQYLHKFPDRRPLVIAPKNECGCQKLFPTYINPTALGYPEFLDCVTTVEFLKDFFKPDLMNPPTKFPERIRSHTTVIKKRNANAFEICLIAVSSILANGYNAYIVDGYVSRTLSTIDTTEDYHEPLEKPILPYEIGNEAETEENKMSAFDRHSFDYGYLLEEREEIAVPTVSPSKYRFKKKGGENTMDGNPGGDIPLAETPSLSAIPEHVSPRASATVVAGTLPANEAAKGQTSGKDQGEGGDYKEADELEDNAEEEEEEEAGEDHEMSVGVVAGVEEEEDIEEEEEPSEPDEELPSSAKDRYHGRRTHAWILVLPGGMQDVEKPFFLEPFSGTLRAIKDPNFLRIEAVFNHKNYWINIQPQPKNLRKLNYDLNNPSAWSCLLNEPEYKKKNRNVNKGTNVFQDEEEEDMTGKAGHLCLTMPISWTTDLNISQEEYDMKYPDGTKTIEYNNAIVELAAPYVNDDGLVRKVLKFTGPSRDPEDLEYIEENFEHRKDKLMKRKWLRDGKMLHEYFAQGRKDALKEHVHVSGRNRPDFPRDLYYYSNAHPRNVSHRRIIKKGMIETFEDREDKLHYKITLFGGLLCNTIPTKEDENRSKARHIIELVKGAGSGGGGGKKRARRKITKIVEKYDRSDDKEPNLDIAEKHMLVDEGRLRILFHYNTGHFTRNTLEFYKGVKPGQSKYAPVEYRPEDCIEYLSDREAEPMNVYKKFLLLQQMDRDERSSSVLSREAEDEIYQTVSSRVQEDWRHEIEPDSFAGDRNEEYLKTMREQQMEGDGEEELDMSTTDFTTPFFEKYGFPRSKKEEILMKKRIMLHEKVKILRRAYMIKELYDTESSMLREKQDWYSRHVDQMNQTQEEDFSHMYKERIFRMHILEQRMVRHQQETPRQYYNLLVQLLRHPQLNRFTNKKVPPPPPPIRELTEEEKARIAKELAKLKDCCQFYSIRYTEPRRSKVKKHEADGGEIAPSGEVEQSPQSSGQKQRQPLNASQGGDGSSGSAGESIRKTPSNAALPSVPPPQRQKDSGRSSTGGKGGRGPLVQGETDVAKL